MIYTKFSTFTNAELLSLVQTARLHSPIIEELAGRFERLEFGENGVLAKTEESAQKQREFSCPVCEAKLLGSVDLVVDCFTIEIKQ